MRTTLLVNDSVRHRITGEKGSVIAVSEKYGWVMVRYQDGHTKEYTYLDTSDTVVVLDLEG